MRTPVALLCALAALSVPQDPTADLVVRNARVLHGDGRITNRATIVVRSGRIRAILPQTSPAPAAAQAIDASGRTLLPGLIDAHVRVSDWMLPLFLRYGVTTVRDVRNDPRYILPLAADDAPDRPRIVAAGAALDGPGEPALDAVPVETLAAARSAVRRTIESGADLISVAPRLHQVLIASIVEEADARGSPVAASLGKTTALEAASAGIASLELLSGIAEAASSDPDRLRRAHDDAFGGWTAAEQEWLRETPAQLAPVADALASQGVMIVPGLVVRDALAGLAEPAQKRDPTLAGVPGDVLANEWNAARLMARAHWTSSAVRAFRDVLARQIEFVSLFASRGGRIVAGTGTPRPFVVPGWSLHHELQLYVAAGLSPAAALRTATIDAAALLRLSDRIGTIDIGKDADFVVVDGDPLLDIRATTRIVLVVRAGHVVAGTPDGTRPAGLQFGPSYPRDPSGPH